MTHNNEFPAELNNLPLSNRDKQELARQFAAIDASVANSPAPTRLPRKAMPDRIRLSSCVNTWQTFGCPWTV